MAELHVYVGPDLPSGRLSGDIISVMPDGSHYGSLGGLETFLVVSINLDLADARQYFGPLLGDELAWDEDAGEMRYPTIYRSRYYVDTSGIDLAAIRATDWTVPIIPESAICERTVA